MAFRILRTPDDLADMQRLLGNLKLPVTLTWTPGADRTLEQNALQWMWAAEVAKQFGDRHAEDVQAEWKLEIGVPILRTADDEFRGEYDAVIRPLPYEQKLRIMKLGWPVTSRMKVRQMVAYMDEVQRRSLEMGLHLTEPDPDLRKYHDRYREKALT